MVTSMGGKALSSRVACSPIRRSESCARICGACARRSLHSSYAALIAGVLAAGTFVYETLDGPRPATSDVAGTMAAAGAPTTLDTVRLGNGAVSGRVSLYRDRAGLGLEFELVASAPVDVLV